MKRENGQESNPVDELVSKVLESPKYAMISETLIRRIVLQELEKRDNGREALKAVKNKLHQVGGAYLERPADYQICYQELTSAFHQGQDDFLQACRRVMCYHSSTRERLPEIDQFYRTILYDLRPIRSVIDVACGLNPLSIPWMGLLEEVEYTAIDIYADMIEFVGRFIKLIGIQGLAQVGDIIGQCPKSTADVAFVLKTIPCLEQVDKSAGVKLLDGLNVKYMVVSFPIHSLGGRRDKGMLENYAKRFNDIIADRRWAVHKYEFLTELVFVVSK